MIQKKKKRLVFEIKSPDEILKMAQQRKDQEELKAKQDAEQKAALAANAAYVTQIWVKEMNINRQNESQSKAKLEFTYSDGTTEERDVDIGTTGEVARQSDDLAADIEASIEKNSMKAPKSEEPNRGGYKISGERFIYSMDSFYNETYKALKRNPSFFHMRPGKWVSGDTATSDIDPDMFELADEEPKKTSRIKKGHMSFGADNPVIPIQVTDTDVRVAMLRVVYSDVRIKWFFGKDKIDDSRWAFIRSKPQLTLIAKKAHPKSSGKSQYHGRTIYSSGNSRIMKFDLLNS